MKNKAVVQTETKLNLIEAEIGKRDLLYFAKEILGYPDIVEFHKEVADILEKGDKKKKLILLPRKCLKTTLVSVAYTMQRIVRNPNIRVLISNAIWDNSRKMVREIQSHFEKSKKFRSCYGDMVGSKKWTLDELIVKNRTSKAKEATITSSGLERTLTSGHFDLIILDDLVAPENIGTAEQIQKVIDYYKSTLDLLEEDGDLIILGTRYDDNDLYGWIINNFESDFDIIIKKMIQDNGTILFPKKFDLKKLEDKKRHQGTYHFSCQYQNEPVPPETQLFKRGYFKYYDSELIDTAIREQDHAGFKVYITADPAIGQVKKSDYTVLMAVAVKSVLLPTSDVSVNQWYILKYMMEHLQPHEIINSMLDFAMEFAPIVCIGIEDIAFQVLIKQAFSEACRRRNINVPIRALKPAGRNKKIRIADSLQPLYENGTIFHRKGMIDLEMQLLRFPKGVHDDLIDALAYVKDIVSPPQAIQKESNLSWWSFERRRKQRQKIEYDENLGYLA